MNNLFFSNPKEKNFVPSSCKNKNTDFKHLKNNTINSLNEVEFFLNNFQKFKNYLKLYKFLK